MSLKQFHRHNRGIALKSILSKIFPSWKDGKSRETLAILFADIARSTYLYETLGDKAAQEIVSACLSLLSEITVQHQGKVIKTIGDEVMCTFPMADDAVNAAEEMHRAVEKMEVSDTVPLNIRAGIHIGPVICENDDVFGDAVNVAARMVGLAKQRQIIATEDVINALNPESDAMPRCIDRTTIKGKRGEHDIYELIWEQHAVTVMVSGSSESRPSPSHAELRLGNRTIQVSQTRPCVTMGRQPYNDLMVDDDRVSRSHARVEYRRGKFVLTDDQSTNGTYLIVKGEVGINIHRDEVTLNGDGIIGLGWEVEPDSPKAIHFAVRY